MPKNKEPQNAPNAPNASSRSPLDGSFDSSSSANTANAPNAASAEATEPTQTSSSTTQEHSTQNSAQNSAQSAANGNASEASPAGASAGASAGATGLQEQLQKAIAERDEYRDVSLRKVAELENFRRRTEQERAELVSYGNAKLLLRLLPVLDDLQRAVESGKSGSDYKALIEGIELVCNKAVQTFEDAGVKPIETIGKQFDVAQHEALMQMPSEAPEGQIIQEAQRGYIYGEKVLRHAKVLISAGQG
jgi:molecular chaperone GrpE